MQPDDTLEESESLLAIHKGFPNPALERKQGFALDLNQLLVRQPRSTYLFRVAGHRLADQGIYDGDIVVVDRAVSVRPNDYVLNWQEDNFGLRRGHQLLENDEHWGVVTAVIHRYRI